MNNQLQFPDLWCCVPPDFVAQINNSLHEKCPNTEFFSGPYFPVFNPNTGKYGPEKSPYLDTFHSVNF